MNKRHAGRLSAEKRFRLMGQCALGLAVAILIVLLGSLLIRGYAGFFQTRLALPVTFDAQFLGISPEETAISRPPFVYQRLAKTSLYGLFPEVADAEQKSLDDLLSNSAGLALKRALEGDPTLLSTRAVVQVPVSSAVDLYMKDQADDRLSEQQKTWLQTLRARGDLTSSLNETFFTRGDSRNPEQAGFLGAIAGSGLTLLVCLALVFPLGVATAVYLEEFARRNFWTELIEVNINNLAAVPSIVFGLLGLAVYINVMGLPRSSALVGGMTLALMILPVIIITTRTSLAAIPPSIRDGARALGATPVQVVLHHSLPLAMPGIMTGTILGMARAIGETAPLLLVGMVAFVVDVPSQFTAPATVMPVQVYLWASSPEAGFAEKTAAGILVLLVLLLLLNALAIILRKRFEIRW